MIQLHHWRPEPRRPPSPNRNSGSVLLIAPPPSPITKPVLIVANRMPASAAGAVAADRATGRETRDLDAVDTAMPAEDIDTGARVGLGHPMGPLTLCDFIGLDVLYAVCDSLYEEFKRPEYAPPPLLKRMVVSGHHGRKTGRGFYEYA